jgi:hypothetical protein
MRPSSAGYPRETIQKSSGSRHTTFQRPQRLTTPLDIHLIGGVPLSSRFRQEDPQLSIRKILVEGDSPACHPVFFPGKLTNADLMAHSVLMTNLARGALRTRGVSYPIARIADHSGPIAREFADRIMPDSKLLLEQLPLPAVVAHKPFDVKSKVDVPLQRLAVLDSLVKSQYPAVICESVARAGRPLRVSRTSSISDLAHEIKAVRPSFPPSATEALFEAHAAQVSVRTRTASMFGIREESSSFGRFFTLPAVLARVADMLVS